MSKTLNVALSPKEIQRRFLAYLRQRGGIGLDQFCTAIAVPKPRNKQGGPRFAQADLKRVDALCQSALEEANLKIDLYRVAVVGDDGSLKSVRYRRPPHHGTTVNQEPAVKCYVDPTVIRRQSPPPTPEPRRYVNSAAVTVGDRPGLNPLEEDDSMRRTAKESEAILREILADLHNMPDDQLTKTAIITQGGFSSAYLSRNPHLNKEVEDQLRKEKNRRRHQALRAELAAAAPTDPQKNGASMDMDAELSQLKAQLEALRAENAALKSQATTPSVVSAGDVLANEMATLRDRLCAISAQIAQLEEEAAAVQAKIQALETAKLVLCPPTPISSGECADSKCSG